MQGLILINKPSGITSFGAVARIKKAACEKRVGHTGTLDPLASGVLPIFIGRATSLSSYLLDSDKTYIASVRLGITTDSYDITGNILSESKVDVSNTDVIRALKGFEGEIHQIPPMYSAIKKDGVRLYELARKGQTLEIEGRKVNIRSIEQISELNCENEFSFSAKVSKGTYIRSLCNDIGAALGVGATMTSLCRTSVSGFDIGECIDLDDITPENIGDYILNEELAVSHLREVFVTENQAKRFCFGGQLSFERLKSADFDDNELLRIKCGDKFLGIGFGDNAREQIGIKCIINKYE